MKILYYTYPWAFDCLGGGERQLMAYRSHLAKLGIQIHLYDMWNPQFKDASIFHLFSTMPSTVEIADYAKRQGLKLVVSPNLWVTKETKSQYQENTIWNLFELADAIIANSNAELNVLSDTFGFPPEKFHVVYNAADTDFLLQEDSSIFRNTYNIEGPYVLNVANIETRKNQLRFLKVLRQERPDLSLVIAGNMRDPQYAEACREAGGDKLVVVGQLPYASPMLRSALCGCEFFAMPSLIETPSIAAIEAAAIGAKILLTDQGSTTEYFGQSVTYVNPELESSLAAGIKATAQATNENSTWVARHDYLWPRVIPSLVNVYESLL